MKRFKRAALLNLAFSGCFFMAGQLQAEHPADKFRAAEKTTCTADEDIKLGDLQFSKLAEIAPKTPGWGILEGPVWVNNRLLMSNIGVAIDKNPNPADLVMLHDGEITVIKSDYGSNGLTLDNDGYVLAPRHKDGSITRIANNQTLANQYDSSRFNSPNDAVVAKEGSVFFSDPDWQNPEPTQKSERLYQVLPNGKITAFGETIEKPNGVMLSHDEMFLYAGGTNGLFKFRLDKNGAIINTATSVDAVKGGIDGMSRDCAGNLYVTNHKQILILEKETDKILKTFSFDIEGIDGVTNIAFGGAGGKTIFVTTMGSKPAVWSAKSTIAGLPY